MAGEDYGEINTTRLSELWRMIDAAEPRLDAADVFNADPQSSVTARRDDERQTGGKRLYIIAHQLLRTALGHDQALRVVLREGGVTIFGPWTLMRTIFEATVWVHWLLEPDASVERRARGLRRMVLDQQEALKFYKAGAGTNRKKLRSVLAQNNKRIVRYKAEARELGMKWDDIYRGINMVQDSVKLQAVKQSFQEQASMMEVLWRNMSGHAHAYSYAVSSSSKVEQSEDIPGGQAVTLTVNDVMFTAFSQGVALLMLKAMILFHARSTVPVTDWTDDKHDPGARQPTG